MKKILYSLFICLSFVLFSCEKDTDDTSKVTYFATLELKGEKFIKLGTGDTYAEPGFVATEGENDITDKVIVKGNVNTSVPGFYTLTYSVANVDGFSATKDRDVMVVDPNNFASTYLAETETATRHYFDAPINITNNGDGTYTIDDLIGGLQFHGLNPGFEPAYDFHAEAIIVLEADNTITLKSVGSWYFESSVALGLNNGAYNPATGIVKLSVDYGGTPLQVTLTK